MPERKLNQFKGRIRAWKQRVALTAKIVADVERSAADSGAQVSDDCFQPPGGRGDHRNCPSSERLRALDFAADRRLALSGKLGEYRILHFATHGLLNNKVPALSGLVFSLVDEQGQPRNGFLRLHEIYNLKAQRRPRRVKRLPDRAGAGSQRRRADRFDARIHASGGAARGGRSVESKRSSHGQPDEACYSGC